MRCTVAHLGVPVGTVDLPEGRAWAGGLLSPAAGFAQIADVLGCATREAGAFAVAGVMDLAAGAPPATTTDLSPSGASAIEALAALEFELRDEAGLRVSTDVVRLGDCGDGKGVRVRASFRLAGGGSLAARQFEPRDELNAC